MFLSAVVFLRCFDVWKRRRWPIRPRALTSTNCMGGALSVRGRAVVHSSARIWYHYVEIIAVNRMVCRMVWLQACGAVWQPLLPAPAVQLTLPVCLHRHYTRRPSIFWVLTAPLDAARAGGPNALRVGRTRPRGRPCRCCLSVADTQLCVYVCVCVQACSSKPFHWKKGGN